MEKQWWVDDRGHFAPSCLLRPLATDHHSNNDHDGNDDDDNDDDNDGHEDD